MLPGIQGIHPVIGTSAEAGEEWTPDALGTDIQAWWDPAVGVSFHSGTSVQYWVDKVNGRQLEGSLTVSPERNATGLNGLPTIDFDVSGRRMFGPYLYTGTQFTLFAIMRYANAGNAFGRYFSHGNTTLSTDYQQNDTWQLSRDNTTTTVGANRNNVTFGNTAIGYDTWFTVMVVFDGTNQTMYVNNSVAGTPSANSAAFATDRLALFYSADSGLDNDFGCGRVADIITMHRPPTADERTNFDTWASNRYGI